MKIPGECAMTRAKAITAAISLSAAALLLLHADKAAAQAGPLYIYTVDLDIVPADFEAFMPALKENAAASIADPGCREFDIAVSQRDPYHVFLFEVYDNEAALRAHEATDHFKKYSTISAGMVLQRDTQVFSSAAMNRKGD
jgi:autoinducer 2-degrading protein